jgi:hypothetical protein
MFFYYHSVYRTVQKYRHQSFISFFCADDFLDTFTGGLSSLRFCVGSGAKSPGATCEPRVESTVLGTVCVSTSAVVPGVEAAAEAATFSITVLHSLLVNVSMLEQRRGLSTGVVGGSSSNSSRRNHCVLRAGRDSFTPELTYSSISISLSL